MTPSPTQQTASSTEAALLADFIHELNVARGNLSLYPADHPQVAAGSQRVVARLEKLLTNRAGLSLGVAPEALLFEHQWLDQDNRAFKSLAALLFNLGIASLTFKQGLIAAELVRFCQLLRSDRQSIENFGGFDLLLQQQQIQHVDVVPIDYNAFKAAAGQRGLGENGNLWEDFLHGLLDDILDIDAGGLRLDPKTVAEILNQKLVGDDMAAELPDEAVDSFVERLLDSPAGQPESASERQLGQLLNHLSPELQETFLAGTLNTLDSHPESAEEVIGQLSPELLKLSGAPAMQKKLKISSRLVELVGKLATDGDQCQAQKVKTETGPLENDVVKARLDVLFSEENDGRFMPDNYQQALKNIYTEDAGSDLSETACDRLKEIFEEQSIEWQCCLIIFELLSDRLELEDEEAAQQNLLDLSRFFLDTGNFSALREIYENWSRFVQSGKSHVSIFEERILSTHTQQTFMLEVLDGIELWGETQAEPILNYIATVGEAYTEPVIEQLGLANQFRQRRYWMKVLEAIGADANQLLVQALNDERWYLIRNLLIVLGKNLAPATLKAVHELSDHPHPKVRQEVMRVLFHCNPATANRMLLKELASDDPEARLAAVQVADLSNDPEVLRTLHSLLQSESDALGLELKRQLLITLSLIGHRDSLSVLRLLLRKKGLFQSKAQKSFQLDIIQSLHRYPSAAAEQLLQEIASCRNRQQARQAELVLQQMSGEQP